MADAKFRRDAGAAEGTINLELASLSHFFTIATTEKWLPAASGPVIKKKTPKLKPMIALSSAESAALLAAAAGDQDPDSFVFIAAGLFSAMRHGEILRTEYREIQFERCILYIPEAKAGAREQPITPQLAAILRKRQQSAEDKEGYIFPPKRPGKLKSKHRRSMRAAFKRVAIAAGLNPRRITRNTLRRTAITTLILAGTPLPRIQKISGHKTIAMVTRYFHLYVAHVHDAVAHLEIDLPSALAQLQVVPDSSVTPELHAAVTMELNFSRKRT